MLLSACLVALVLPCTAMAAKFVVPPCDYHKYSSNVNNCLSEFNSSMATSGYQERCPWPTVKRTYNELKFCVDYWANLTWCKGHKFLVDEVFLQVHETYFSRCGQVQDPPLTTMFLLIIPSIAATFLLSIVCSFLTPCKANMP